MLLNGIERDFVELLGGEDVEVVQVGLEDGVDTVENGRDENAYR